MRISPKTHQRLILKWFDQHGRKHFPWQQNKTPYRVWVSEIMLQQTQVNTVIPYYETFMQAFPKVESLAHAHQDQVLHLWAGLGYYSRARNLHRAAKMIMEEFGGEFPSSMQDVQKLPGIGRSTAGAILSLALNQATPILDGNVKRVLARLTGITQPIDDKKVQEQMWQLAEQYMPSDRAADYSQAMMDLGATLCLRSTPQCAACPLTKHCAAHQQGLTHLLPAKKAKQKLPKRTACFFILEKNGQVLLEKRPPMGIWGGLWSLPELKMEEEGVTVTGSRIVTGSGLRNCVMELGLGNCEGKEAGETGETRKMGGKEKILAYCRKKFNIRSANYDLLEPFKHSFSHYHLHIQPILISVKRLPSVIMEDGQQIWYNPKQPESLGLPKPVQSIMQMLVKLWENSKERKQGKIVRKK